MKKIRPITVAIMITMIALPGTTWTATESQHSGFLQDYDGFTADPDRAGARVYWAPGFDVRRYYGITFDPVEIWLHPDSEYKGLKPERLKALADSFRDILIKGAWDSFVIVEKPGPGVIRVRAAITNVLAKKPKRKWTAYTPIGAVSVGVKKAAGKDYVLGEAVLEAELLDSQTDQRLAALVDTQVGAEQKKKDNKPGKWKDVEKSLEFYANRFRQRMEKARGSERIF